MCFVDPCALAYPTTTLTLALPSPGLLQGTERAGRRKGAVPLLVGLLTPTSDHDRGDRDRDRADEDHHAVHDPMIRRAARRAQGPLAPPPGVQSAARSLR